MNSKSLLKYQKNRISKASSYRSLGIIPPKPYFSQLSFSTSFFLIMRSGSYRVGGKVTDILKEMRINALPPSPIGDRILIHLLPINVHVFSTSALFSDPDSF
jgi:hypothetical protein